MLTGKILNAIFLTKAYSKFIWYYIEVLFKFHQFQLKFYCCWAEEQLNFKEVSTDRKGHKLISFEIQINISRL